MRPPGARPRVLLADDNQAALESASRMLETDFEVAGTATDGQALLEAESELQPDVLVVDITMPKVSGFGAARRLKEEGSRAKFVFLTAHADPDYVREALAVGALGYVIKPRVASDLVLAVKEALAGRFFVSPPLKAVT